MNQLKTLQVWQKSIKLAKDIYKLTGALPDNEKFGLVTQMNRAAVSIASNIAEGAGRETTKEFMQFLNFAMGSTYELETQIILSKELEFTPGTDAENNLEQVYEIQKMLAGLRNTLKPKSNNLILKTKD